MEGKKLIKQGQEIFKGFKNSIFKNEEVEIEAERRLRICFNCEFRKDKKCGACGCLLYMKSRSTNSQCPKQKW